MKKKAMNVKSLQIAALLALSAIAVATALMLLIPDPNPITPASEPPQSTDGTTPSTGAGRLQTTIPTEPPGTLETGAQETANATAMVTARNPFIADAGPVGTTSPTSAMKVTSSTSDMSIGHRQTALTTETAARPRYESETAFFLSRLPSLREVLRTSRFFSAEYEVDPANPAIMVILSVTEERARNLDGFFRFALDRDGETWGSAPLALGLDRLYAEAGRDRAYADTTFCSDGLDGLLDRAIRAMLGGAYEPGVTAFILERYRDGMAARVRGESRPSSRVAASFAWLDVVYSAGYVNYVEFYPNPNVVKG